MVNRPQFQNGGYTVGGRKYKALVGSRAQVWNGTAWTEVADLSAARKEVAGGGTQSLGFCAGGSPSVTTVEEWTKAQNVKTITD